MEPPNVIENDAVVFVDTAALIALVSTRDSLHAKAIALIKELRIKKAQLITTESVLFEFCNALSAIEFRSKAAVFVDALRTNSNIPINASSADMFEKSLMLYRKRSDKEWSLTDCNSFTVMQEQKITYAFTSDKHFEQAGFIKLLQA
jgi:predicted nucleic acid-binding protein